jgi:hypothetical protein
VFASPGFTLLISVCYGICTKPLRQLHMFRRNLARAVEPARITRRRYERVALVPRLNNKRKLKQ